MSLFDSLGNFVAGNVQSVTIETAFTPPLVVDQPLQGGPTPNPILAIIRPRVTVNTGGLMPPQVFAPWGEPIRNYWPFVQAALIIAATGAAIFIIKKVRG